MGEPVNWKAQHAIASGCIRELQAKLAKLEHETRGITFQTPDEKDARIEKLEAALLEGVKAVNGLLAKNKELTAYKVAGEWRESVKALVVNYGTAEHPCSVPPPLETKGEQG